MSSKIFQTAKPYLYVFLAFLQAALTSGVIYGWPALENIFEEEGFYSDHCKPDQTDRPCKPQTNFFNLIFTIAVFVNNAAPLITGVFLDFFGPKKTNIGSAILFFIGCGLFAVPGDYFVLPAFTILGLAGPGIYCSIMHLCNLFPGHQPSVLSFFSGTFSVSSLIFKCFQLIYKPTQYRDLRSIFIEYIVLLSPLFIIGAFIWPNKPFEPPGAKLIKDANVEEEPLVSPSSQRFGNKRLLLYNVPAKKQFKTPLYWIPVLWLAFESLDINCYLGTVTTRFPTGSMADHFNLIWSFGWVSIPFFGLMMDYYGITPSMLVTSIGLLIFRVLIFIPVAPLQYVSFVLVSTMNVGMWGSFYSYLSKLFGFANYGKLLGVSSLVVAVIGALQYALDSITNDNFKGNFLFTDSVSMVLSVVSTAFSFYVWYALRAPSKKKNAYYPAINNDDEENVDYATPGYEKSEYEKPEYEEPEYEKPDYETTTLI